ncbi:IS1 family transposase, partial [Escherichia coli]|nr:IS1 family transposase [Escherichia coli]MED8433023.1 IS1 family transposase [Escherichia coli]
SVTSRIQPGSDVIVCAEMDEQWGYVGAKSRQRWLFYGHCCKVSDEAAFCLIQRPYISKTLLTRRISPRGSP